jgi:ribosomal protein S18 acetylase RimI-like enzyme
VPAEGQAGPLSTLLIGDLAVVAVDMRDKAAVLALSDFLQESSNLEMELSSHRDRLSANPAIEDLKSAREIFLFCRFAGRPAGVLSYARTGAGLKVCRFAVLPTYSRNGVAPALVRFLGMRETRAAVITVDINAVHRAAISFYRGLGFHIERRWATPDGLSMVMMMKTRV